MGRFRSSSLGSGAIILAFLLLLLHRYGTGLLFLVVGAALLWYGRMQREARERAAGSDAADVEASTSQAADREEHGSPEASDETRGGSDERGSGA